MFGNRYAERNNTIQHHEDEDAADVGVAKVLRRKRHVYHRSGGNKSDTSNSFPQEIRNKLLICRVESVSILDGDGGHCC